jgi:hypothetical protein
MYQPERDFVSCARERMQLLLSGDSLDTATQNACLQDISASAKTVTARAVMMCADRCAVGLNADIETHFELRTLNRLIEQFASGLAEIDTQAPQAAVPAPEPALVSNDNIQAAKDAAKLLEPLIVLAPQTRRAALSSLVAFASGNDTDRVLAPVTDKTISLESLIAPVTSSALSRAHLGHKRISLSYACEDALVHEDIAAPLQKLLSALCATLIVQSVRHPGVREAAGLAATSQIALTANADASGLALDVFCDDLPLSHEALQSPSLERAIADYRVVGGAFDAAQDRTAGSLLSITHKAPRKKPHLAESGLNMEPMRLRQEERA